MNTVLLQGNLVRDPEIRVTDDGRKRALFCVAVNESFGDEERVHFVDVTAFSGQNGNFADNIATSLAKGQRVLVAGRLNTYQRTVKFVDDDGGGESEPKKRTMLSLTASEVGPGLRYATAQVDRNPRRDNTDAAAPAAAPAATEPAPTPAAAASDAEVAF